MVTSIWTLFLFPGGEILQVNINKEFQHYEEDVFMGLSLRQLLWSGVAVAAISPFFAFMFGIGPALFQIVPAVALGNVVLVLAWHFVPKLFKKEDSIAYNLVTAIVAAVVKFLTLYLVIVKLLIPTVLKLPDPQASVMSATFSTPQLITALIGGIIAVIIVPALKKAVNKSK